MACVFQGITPASDGLEEVPLNARLQGEAAIGAPSTGLSLGGLLASRARFRFTRLAEDSEGQKSGKSNPDESSRQRRQCRDDLTGIAKECSFLV